LLADGYTVAAMRMPLFQSPSHCGLTGVHDKLFDVPLKEGSPLKFFLEPIARTINYLLKENADLKEVDMVGLSGGGWTTTVYAAIDPRIIKSFPVAGSLPLYLRGSNYNHDLEQYFAPIYRVAGYKDLYVLGASGEGRFQVQILNRYDDCCFASNNIRWAYHPIRKPFAITNATFVRFFSKCIQAALPCTWISRRITIKFPKRPSSRSFFRCLPAVSRHPNECHLEAET
jgi:pimeloyl-ACP methyl ester carboxylesterase